MKNIVYSPPCLSKTDEPYEKKLLNNAGSTSIKVWMHIFSLTITPPSVVMKHSLSLNVNAMLNVDIHFFTNMVEHLAHLPHLLV